MHQCHCRLPAHCAVSPPPFCTGQRAVSDWGGRAPQTQTHSGRTVPSLVPKPHPLASAFLMTRVIFLASYLLTLHFLLGLLFRQWRRVFTIEPLQTSATCPSLASRSLLLETRAWKLRGMSLSLASKDVGKCANFGRPHLEWGHLPPGAQDSRGNHSRERERMKRKQEQKSTTPERQQKTFMAASYFLDCLRTTLRLSHIFPQSSMSHPGLLFGLRVSKCVSITNDQKCLD